VGEDRGLVRGVCVLTAASVAGLAAGAWLLLDAHQAAGVLAGGLIAIGNFLWLGWTTQRALGPSRTGASRSMRGLVWVGASGVRLGLVGLAVGVAVTQGWLGLTGLLAALLALPVAIVIEGLRMVRLA